ncbi:MAG: SemiSWEET family transporter [Ramlibacter sp.]
MWQIHRPDRLRPVDPAQPHKGLLQRILPTLSVFTMAMTVPQVWSVWVQRQTAGVSLLSWGAYLLSACLWLAYGLGKKDKTIWVACIGWVLLDAAVVVGVLWPH